MQPLACCCDDLKCSESSSIPTDFGTRYDDAACRHIQVLLFSVCANCMQYSSCSVHTLLGTRCWSGPTDLGGRRRVGFLEERPDARPDVLPAAELAVLVRVLETEALHDVLLGELVGVEVEPVENLQRLLRVAVRRVRHPDHTHARDSSIHMGVLASCTSSNSTAPPGSRPDPRSPAPPRTAGRIRRSGSAACRCDSS